MSVLGLYPVGSGKVNWSDIMIECTECGARQMMSATFYCYVGLSPACSKCGNSKWFIVFGDKE